MALLKKLTGLHGKERLPLDRKSKHYKLHIGTQTKYVNTLNLLWLEGVIKASMNNLTFFLVCTRLVAKLGCNVKRRGISERTWEVKHEGFRPLTRSNEEVLVGSHGERHTRQASIGRG